MELSLYKPKGS